MPDGVCNFSPTKSLRPDSVRIADASDEGALFDIVCEAHDDNGIFGKSEPKLRQWAAEFSKRDGLHLTGVIDGADGRVDACVALILIQPWYSDDWFVEDRLVYVRRDKRNSRHAADLLQFAKWYSETLGVPLGISVLPKRRWQDKTRFFSRYLPQVGSLFLYDGKA